jgi:xylan 1,4-beta-xylosidase
VLRDFEQPVQKVADRPFYTTVIPDHPAAPVELSVTHLVPGAPYRLELYRTGYDSNDACTAYLRIGAPKSLTGPQIAQLDYLTRDQPERDRIERAGQEGSIEVSIPMRSNDVVLVTLCRSCKAGPPIEYETLRKVVPRLSLFRNCCGSWGMRRWRQGTQSQLPGA